MDKKTGILFIIITLTSLFVGYSYSELSNDKEYVYQEDKNILANQKIAVLGENEDMYHFLSRFNPIPKKKIHNDISWYKSVDYEYPAINIPGVNIIKDRINKEIGDLICNNDIDKIAKDDLVKIKDSPNGNLDCSLSIEYSVTSNGHLVTHILDENFYDGGPRTFYSIKTFTFDRNGNEYKISDLIKDERKDNYKTDLIKILKESFLNQYNPEQYFNFNKQIFFDLITSEIVDKIPFQVETDKILFIFTEAEGLSHSTGMVLISVPTKELKGILQERFFRSYLYDQQ